MWTNEQRIQFAVRFAADSLDHYRQGDWLNLREDLGQFMPTSKVGEVPADLVPIGIFVPSGSPAQSTESELRKLQTEIRNLLNIFVLPAEDGVRALPSIQTTLTYTQFQVPGQVIVLIEGQLRDCLLGLLLRLLERGETSPIMRCPQCQTIFYRSGKQLFCTRTCTNRAMVQRKRAGKAKPRKMPIRRTRVQTIRRSRRAK